MANGNAWADRSWQEYRKHLPPRPRVKQWAQIVRETSERGHKGYYHQELLGLVEQFETDCLNTGKFLSENGPTRYYWKEYDRVIGASCGEETRFLLVEWHQSGKFHGHPVTEQELIKKGMER